MRRASSNIGSSILSQGAVDGVLVRRLSSTIVLTCLAKCGGGGTPPTLGLQQLKEGCRELLGRNFTEVNHQVLVGFQ
jgi:hypothetical protein